MSKQTNQTIELEIKFLIDSDKVSELRKKILKLPKMAYKGKFYEKTTMLDNSIGLMQKDDARLRVRQINDKKNQQKFKNRIFVQKAH